MTACHYHYNIIINVRYDCYYYYYNHHHHHHHHHHPYSVAMYKVPTPYDLSCTKASVFSWMCCSPSVGGGNDVITTIMISLSSALARRTR